MSAERRKQVLLGALLAVLVVVMYRAWTEPSGSPGASSNERAAARAGAGADAAQTGAPDVHLKALTGERPTPAAAERNLFRFRPKPPPAPPVPPRLPPATAATNPATLGPPPPAPITLKFIGIIEQSGKRKFAVLSDGIGPPMYGEEGKTVAGRYRILRIGAESIEMSYLDGRGRQTIRMTGS
jgi:hypothetical protein